jgi:putative tryptophan/tyrosine transport system substrate-binding protein
MKRFVGFLSIFATLAAGGVAVQAQQPKKVFRIGYLSGQDPASESARSEPFRLALRELGYIEGQNIAIEYRNAEGKLDRYPELAAELVRLKVDIIVTTGGSPTLAAKNATKTIPIVMLAFRPILSRQAWLKALPVPAATSPALQPFPGN